MDQAKNDKIKLDGINAVLLPPSGPWLQRSLGLQRSLYLKRSSFCCLLFLRNEPAFHVLLCRFRDPSEPLTLLFRQCFAPVGKLNHDKLRSRQPILFLPTRVTLPPVHFPIRLYIAQ